VPRVLLVEDEEHLAAGIRFNLELDGYDVEMIGDGLRAVERLAPAPEGPAWDAGPAIDLVVLDDEDPRHGPPPTPGRPRPPARGGRGG